MPQRFVRNEPAYRRVSFEAAKIKAAAKRAKASRKQPTSVALDAQLIAELKAEAEARGVPYQVLMRMFIVDGFKRLKRAG